MNIDHAILEFGSVVQRIPGWEGVMSLVEATPTQLRYARERKARLCRMSANAVRDDEIVPKRKPLRDERQKYLPYTIWLCADESLCLPEPPREPAPQTVTPTIHQIVQAVAAFYQVSINDILSIRRFAAIVRPRQVVCYLARVLTQYSYPEIGRLLGGRDHTTVMNGVKKIERLREVDPVLHADLETLAAKLGSGK